MKLKQVLIADIEDYLNKGNSSDQRQTVALCQIVFKNAHIVHKLQKRGEYLSKKKAKKVDKANKELTDYCRENVESLTTPKEAFITLE